MNEDMRGYISHKKHIIGRKVTALSLILLAVSGMGAAFASSTSINSVVSGILMGQNGLNNFFDTPNGNAAPIVAQCDGGGDEQAFLSAATTASGSSVRTGINVPHGCTLHNKWQIAADAFVSLFGWAGGNMDGTTMGSVAPRITVDTDAINQNSSIKAAIDMNGPTELSLNGVNIKGTNQSTYAVLIANGSQNGGCCAKNALELNNVSLSTAQALVGCPVQFGTFGCVSGTAGSPNYLPRSIKSQYSNFETVFTGNFSDLMIWNSQFSGGGWAGIPTFGGGGQQIANNRFEFVRGGFWYGNPAQIASGGNTSGSYFNSNSVSQYDDAALIVGSNSGYVANDNSLSGPTAGVVQWNGSFTTDRHWDKGSGWSINTTSGVAEATTASTAISQKTHTSVGVSYTVAYTVTVTAGTITPSVGGTAGTTRNSSGTYSETIVAGSTMGIAFTGSGFSGTLDAITVTPNLATPFIVGGAGVAVTNVSIANNVVSTTGTKLRYGIDLQGPSSDYLYLTGIYSGPTMIAAVNYSNETPAHIVEDTIGAGASSWTGQHAERGRPFGIGTLTPRSTVALDLNGSDNVSKPLGLSVGTTAQRPTCDSNMYGGVRYNSSVGLSEVCTDKGWLITMGLTAAAYNIGNSSTAFTINVANGNEQYVTATGNATATLPSVVAGPGFTLTWLTGAGSFTLSLSGAQWEGGSAPTFTTTASRKDVIYCVPTYDRANWMCSAKLDVR